MKKTITRTFLATLALLFSFSFSSDAQTYYNLYLCDNATATLHPEEPVTPLVANDKVYWFLDGVALPDNPRVYNGNAASIDLVVPIDLAVGLHRYTSVIQTVANCMGDESTPFTICKLPAKTVELSANVLTYCAESSNTENPKIDGSVITAATRLNPNQTLPDGIEYSYEWSVTKDGAPYATLADIGSADGSNSAIDEFTMTVKDKGEYVFTAKVKYVGVAAITDKFRSGDNKGCEVSATQTVKVIPKPEKPIITLQ